jgi:hypothetical protein
MHCDTATRNSPLGEVSQMTAPLPAQLTDDRRLVGCGRYRYRPAGRIVIN